MPYIPPQPRQPQAKTLPTPINSRNNKRTISIKEKPVSIFGWHVDPKRIQQDLGNN